MSSRSLSWVAARTGFCGTAWVRIILVWLSENKGGSVFVAVLFHTMINLSWALFPNAGSYYDPFVTFLILAVAVGLIVFLWGPVSLAQFRYGCRSARPTVPEQPAKGMPDG